MASVVKSLFYFILAGIFEIGGGYMIWLWLRDGKAWWYGVLGAVILIFYGIIPRCSRQVLILAKYMRHTAVFLLFYRFSGDGKSIVPCRIFMI